MRSGLGTAQDASDHQTAKQALEGADAARDAAIDAAFDAGVAALPTAQAQALAKIRANRWWRLPAAYLTVDRTQEGWVDLRDALACERVYDEYGGDPLDAATSQLLSACKSDSTVAAALDDIDTNLAAVQTAWNAAVAD